MEEIDIEDIDVKSCQKLVKAIFLRNIKDTVQALGKYNTKADCRSAFNFLFNVNSDDYAGFSMWCDLSGFDQKNWQELALMIIAYELNFKPWLRTRLSAYLKGQKNWQLLRKYYYKCCEKKYYNFIEGFENDNID